MVIGPIGDIPEPDPDERRAFTAGFRWAVENKVKHPTMFGAVAARWVKEEKERETERR